MLGGVVLVAGPAHAAPACQGAVVHTVDASRGGALPPLCIAVGGVVRIANSGPGTVAVQPATAVDCYYAGGVHMCRLIRTGTVRFTVGTRQMTVRVPASVAGQPSTACTAPGGVVDIDTNDELTWWAPCLRLGATLRFVHLGPGLLTATPADAVTCRYAAGIHACQFRRAATVNFAATLDTYTRYVTAVAVR
jgi:hypothetical protein